MNLPASAGDARDVGWIPGSGRSPYSGKWQPIPAFLPGECHGQRSLDGYNPRATESWTQLRATLLHSKIYPIFSSTFLNLLSIRLLLHSTMIVLVKVNSDSHVIHSVPTTQFSSLSCLTPQHLWAHIIPSS